MKRSEGEELTIFLELAKLKLNYNLTREEIEKDLDHLFKEPTEDELKLLNQCYQEIWELNKKTLK